MIAAQRMALTSARVSHVDEAERYFQHCLSLWVAWMNGLGTTRLRFRSRDSVCGRSLSNYMTAGDDSDIVYEASDRKIAIAVNACVDSLEPHERAAVCRHCGLASVWRFPRVDQAESLRKGMARLRALVRVRC